MTIITYYGYRNDNSAKRNNLKIRVSGFSNVKNNKRYDMFILR